MLALILVIGYSAVTFAQRTISGKVVEKGSGEALPFATVLVEGTQQGVSTNIDGFFSLVNVSEDIQKLEVRYVGYTTTVFDVNSEKDFLIVELEPLREELEEVLVTANAYKVFDATKDVSVTTLSTKQLETLPSVGEPDIFRSLQMLPGVSSTSENSSGLYIRGSTPDQNLTILDGMTMYKVDHFFGFFSAFNTNVIKDVRLYRGAFPAKYGGRTSGVVELTGKTGSFEKFEGGVNISLISFGAYVEAPIGKKFSLLLGGRRSYSEVMKGELYRSLIENLRNDDSFANTPLEDATNISTEPDFYFYDWNSKLSYKMSDKGMITLSTYSGKDYLDESQNLQTDIENQFNSEIILDYKLDEQTNWGNRGASAKWSMQWTPKLYSNVLVAGSEYFSDYTRSEKLVVTQDDTVFLDRGRRTLEENSVIDKSARADFEYQINLRSKAEFGVSVTENHIDYDNIRDDSVVLLQRDQRALYSSAYVSYETTYWDKLRMTAGLRVSDYEYEKGLLYEPRLSLTYQLSPKLKLKSAYGIHYQFANQIVNQNLSEGSREFWLLADGDLIDLSSSTQIVAGASYEIDKWLFDVESFYKDLTGINEFSLQYKRGINDAAEELFRSGNGSSKGVEFLLQKKQGKYTGWVSYTWSDVRHEFPELNDGYAFRPLHYQQHEYKMVHTIESGKWTFSSNFIYGSGKPFAEPANRYQITLLDGRNLSYIGVGAKNSSNNPDYIRLDFSAHIDFAIGKADANVGLSLFNLLGRENIWYTEYDFGQSPPLINQVNYLGFTPNLLFSLKF